MLHDSLTAALNASKNWIKHFNRGDVDYCVSAYAIDAIMEAKPLGDYSGRDDIDNFWRPFVQSGATDLNYTNIWLKLVDENTVHLGANWTMNVGEGVITLEEWVKSDSGTWKLLVDSFEIHKQF
ncbi:nuclear transport factor 2 family protein [Parendozoicomonas haliclonae]|uniref:SnoaL-like domain protein n=1 Tax=Parendozoicomonas haliclonae TaxID=1960125 RepID=A0A1X7ADK2_9GAMM|nr:nuclear transport factor 2 family protein [Parendozoicomonas haliclonae]SMA32011.1 SnoaL-like domain protein [Parendozoicomonas haliclonae]